MRYSILFILCILAFYSEENTDKIYSQKLKKLYSSSDTSNFVNEKKIDFENSSISLSVNESKLIEYKLKAPKNKVVFECESKENLVISKADFDVTDTFQDVFVTKIGLDNKAITSIYRYDGENLKKYIEFNHSVKDFFYDSNGHIYFFNQNDGLDINNSLNYKTKKIEEVR